MALTVQHKRSQTTGDQPTATEIEVGEIALNLADLRMFTKDHNGAIKRIGGEDVAATLDLTVGQGSVTNGTGTRANVPAEGTLRGISVTGFKMNFTKADGTATTYNIFNQMMLFSLFQGHFVSNSIFNAHNHNVSREVTFDNDVSLPTNPNGTTITTDVPN